MNDWARLLLLTALFSLGTCGAGLWFFRHDHDYVFNGPHPVEAADLLKLKSIGELPKPYVRFSPDEVVATGGELYSSHSHSGVPPLARVYLVRIQDRWMVGLLNNHLGQSIEGKLVVGRPYYTKEINAIVRDSQNVHNGQLLPFEIYGYDDETSDARFGYYLCLFFGGLGAMCLVGGLCALFVPPSAPAYGHEAYVPAYDEDEVYSYSEDR